MNDTPVDDIAIVKRNYYEVLNVPINSTEAEIKLAYKDKLLQNHPDKSTQMNTEINLIQQAYKVLIDAEGRRNYDELLKSSIKKQGLVLNGDGLDIYNLQDFHLLEDTFFKQCPRCRSNKAIMLTEDDLINGTTDGNGDYEIIVQCNDCSLWIKVQYSEEVSE